MKLYEAGSNSLVTSFVEFLDLNLLNIDATFPSPPREKEYSEGPRIKKSGGRYDVLGKKLNISQNIFTNGVGLLTIIESVTG